MYRVLKIIKETVLIFHPLKVYAQLWKKNQISLRAAALTYNFILGLIPAIAVCLAVISFFIDIKNISGDLKNFLLKNLATGTGYSVTRYLDQFIENVRFRTIGYIGFAALMFTSILLLSNIEDSMNRIWAIEKNKKIWHRFIIYNLMLILGPIGLAITLSATTIANRYFPELLSQVSFGTVFISALLFSFFYKVMPNTAVKIQWAIFSGVLVAIMSQLAKWGYAKYTAKALFYNKMYGGLAALPLFLVWIYLNWTLFLAGTQLNYFLQNRRSLLSKK